MTLGKTERLHAAGITSAVLLRIILAERDREIADPGWCVNADALGEVVSERSRATLLFPMHLNMRSPTPVIAGVFFLGGGQFHGHPVVSR